MTEKKTDKKMALTTLGSNKCTI